MEIEDFFNNRELYNCASPKKRRYDVNSSSDGNCEEFFSDILSPEEIGFFSPKQIAIEDLSSEYQNNFFFDVIKQVESDPIFSFNMPPKIKTEKENIQTNSFQINTPLFIKNETKNIQEISWNKNNNNVIQNNLQPTYTLDISPKTRVSNNPKDISITVTIKIPTKNITNLKNLPDKILLWSSTKKLTEKVNAICEDGVNEIQVDTSSCFIVLINFDLKDKDDVFVSNCNEHLTKEKQGCQFANYPGPCLFKHVAPLSISKKSIKLKNSNVDAIYLTKTFVNLKIDKKGHFCKSSKYKLNLNSQLVLPSSLQRIGINCTQTLSTNVNYSKQIVTDSYWVEKLMNLCHSAQINFSTQRVYSLSINTPQLSEELSKIISSFQHISEVDVRYVNPFIPSNFILQLLTSIYEKCIHIKVITVNGSIDQWKRDPNRWAIIEKLTERYWDLKIQFYSSNTIETREN